MTRPPLNPSVDELNYFVVAAAVVGAAFTAFSGDFTVNTGLRYFLIGAGVLLFREFGVRTIAQWMEAQVALNLSTEGAFVSVFGAILSVVSGLPIILLFPVYSTFDVESYEQWGKGIDAMWMKREYWLASGAVLGMFLGWVTFFLLGWSTVAQAFSIFLIFQLLPLDYSSIPTGRLDGAYILKQSGFIWLIMFGLSFLTLGLA